MKNIKLISLVTGVLFSITMLSACNAKKDDKAAKEPKGGKTKISIVGSTSVQPLAQSLADEYKTKNDKVEIDIQGVGSSAGIKAIYDGTCDIGTSSRELKAEEKAWGLTEHIIAIDGIAVVVNPKNKVLDLKKDQITKIFKGEIKNWKEVGGIDKEIIVVSREDGSGTRGAFDELTKLEETKDGKKVNHLVENALIAEGNGAVKANIAAKENAIGYVSVGYIDNTIMPVKVEGVEATTENIKAKKYAIARPFLMLTKGELKPEVKAFLDYILSEGQATVSKHYITVK